MNKELIYKCVSDLINESYDWLSDEDVASDREKVQYIIGINDMARYLIEQLDKIKREKDDVD